MSRVDNLMSLSQLVNVPKEVVLSHRVEIQARLVEKQNQLRRHVGRVELVLYAVEPDEETEEPDEAPAALPKRSSDASVPFVPDPQVKVRAIVVGRFIRRVRFDIDFDFEVLVLFPELHDLI